MPDDHSKVEPLLPIPNRTVKRFSANDSEHSFVKVGHRQATIPKGATQPSGPFFSSVICLISFLVDFSLSPNVETSAPQIIVFEVIFFDE